ncbi:MAG: HU family DNA-binding protein [Pseudomonadota bacterium]
MATKKTTSEKSSTPVRKAPVSARRSSTKAATKRPAVIKSPELPVAAAPEAATGEVNKRELVERLMAETGMKKGQARGALEAVLGTLGQVLSEGKHISAAPLGKVKLVRKKDTPNGELVVLRVKLKKPGSGPDAAKNPLAGPTEPK